MHYQSLPASAETISTTRRAGSFEHGSGSRTVTRSSATPNVNDSSSHRWDLLLACVAGYILIAVGRVHQLFPALEAMRPAILTGLFAIGLYVLDRDATRRLGLIWVLPTKCVVALFTWMVLSVPGSLWPGNSFSLVFDNFVKTALMYMVVAGAVRDVRDVERLAAAYLAGATAYAGVVLSRFELGSGDAWRLGHLYYYDANDFATLVVSALPLGLYFAYAARRLLTRMLALLALLVLTVVFVHTGSRGGFLALVAVSGFVLLRYKAIATGWRISAFVLVALLLMATASEQYWRQMGTIFSDADYNHTEETGRLQIWRRGVGYMLQYPVLGVGPGNFQTAEGRLSPLAVRQEFGRGVRWNAAHSSVIQVGAELGVVGLLLFLTLIASTFGALRRVGWAARAEGPTLRDARAKAPALPPAMGEAPALQDARGGAPALQDARAKAPALHDNVGEW
jgi:O-antigen ligase